MAAASEAFGDAPYIEPVDLPDRHDRDFDRSGIQVVMVVLPGPLGPPRGHRWPGFAERLTPGPRRPRRDTGGSGVDVTQGLPGRRPGTGDRPARRWASKKKSMSGHHSRDSKTRSNRASDGPPAPTETCSSLHSIGKYRRRLERGEGHDRSRRDSVRDGFAMSRPAGR